MREKDFQRIIFDFFLLSQADQEALKRRNPQAVCYYAHRLIENIKIYK